MQIFRTVEDRVAGKGKIPTKKKKKKHISENAEEVN